MKRTVFALLTLLLVACNRPTSTQVRDAPSATSAVVEARDVDLPQIQNADRALVTFASDHSTTELRGERLRIVQDALEVADVPPSGGVELARVAFHRGDTLLREIWVYDDGEWGVVRNGTSWTVGRSAKLRAALSTR